MKNDCFMNGMNINQMFNTPFQEECKCSGFHESKTAAEENEGLSAALTESAENCHRNKKRENCCCKKSMIAALKLLCNSELAELIDFEKFAFLTDNFIVGAKLVLFKKGIEGKDNLSDLSGSFRRFSPCNCDLIEIAGTAFYDVPLPVSITDLAEQLSDFITEIIDILAIQPGIIGAGVDILREILKLFDPEGFNEALLEAIYGFIINFFTTLPTVDAASLCGIESVAFEAKDGEVTPSETQTGNEQKNANYQKAKKIFKCELEQGCEDHCGECSCNCECDDCCCADSILKELSNSNISRKVTVAAGNLTLRDVEVLGAKGDVLVIANDKKKRFYFVCANSVQFLY